MLLLHKLGAALGILRLHLAGAAGVCAVVGYVLANAAENDWGTDRTWEAVVLFAIATAIAAGTMPLNDIIDRNADAVNRPDRPIPAGRLTTGEAASLFAVLSVAGLAGAFAVGLGVGIFASALWIVATAYNLVGKRFSVIGNAMVSSCVSGSFAFGGFAASGSVSGVVAAVTVLGFLASLTLETAGDIHDAEGDAAAATRSFTASRGVPAALRLHLGLSLCVLAACIVLPLVIDVFGVGTFAVSVPAGVAFVALSVRFRRIALDEESENRSKRLTTLILIQAGVLMVGVIGLAASVA
jgi:4-hydroxybenzoate polyprenyltransferase